MGDDLMDYTERCRLCIAGSKRLSIDIFSPEGKRSKLQAKISKYLSVKVSEDDKLPSSICYQCLFRLETWVSFKKHCMDSDHTLKNWAFFCGAITPESYLNEANKSPENGSDIEKPNTSHYCAKNDNSGSRARTPLSETSPSVLVAAGSHQNRSSHEDAPSPPAPLSSASSSSSRTRGSESADSKPSKAKDSTSPLNGITREPQAPTSKPGRRKVLRPNKAIPSSPSKDEPPAEVADRADKDIPPDESEDVKVKSEEPARRDSSDSSAGAFMKRKRGRPSKAWLKERAEALKKLREEPEPHKSQESPSEKKSEAVTELIELDDPDFGSMKFTLSVIDSAVVTPSERTAGLYPESSASASSGRLSSDSCFKEEFSGFSIPKVEANPETEESLGVASQETLEDRLNEAGDTVSSSVHSSPGKPERKRSHSASSTCPSDEGEEKLRKLSEVASRRTEDFEVDESDTPVCASELSRPNPISSPKRDINEDARVQEIDEHDSQPAGEIDVGPISSSHLQEMGTYMKEDVTTDTEPQLDDDSDSDVAAPPMSPLSPLRVEFQVIELQVETEERSSECEC